MERPRPRRAGARVATRIASGWRSTTTDLQGRFTLQVDGLPYDLAVVVPGSELDVWQGVTRMDVLARIPVPSQGTRSAAFTTQVAGNCGGAGCPPSGHEGAGNIIFAAGDLSWTGYLQPLGVTAAYTASRAGPDFATGKLFALYWACPTSCQTNAPDSYWYAIQDAVTLRVGVTTDVPTLALAPAPTAQLAVNVSAPAGLSPEANVGFAFGGSRTYWWSPAGLAPVGVNSVLLPVLADLRSMVTIEAHPLSGGWTYARWIGTTPAATPVDLALHELPSLVEPPDGASGVGPGTRFSWSAEARIARAK